MDTTGNFDSVGGLLLLLLHCTGFFGNVLVLVSYLC